MISVPICQAWTTTQQYHCSPCSSKARTVTTTTVLHAATTAYTLEALDNVDADTLRESAAFMMKSFWGLEKYSDGLLSDQMHDFETIYGERIGKRQLASHLILARDDNDNGITGLVGIEVALLNRSTNDDDNDEPQSKILKYSESEQTLKNAISSLGPKQRRQYKDATVQELVSELPDLKGKYEAVIVLANLAVRGDVRGTGFGVKLCREAERIVMDMRNGDDIYRMMLQVEGDNAAAKGLYENKLGYVQEWSDEDASALRADVGGEGTFVEVPCVLLTLGKSVG